MQSGRTQNVRIPLGTQKRLVGGLLMSVVIKILINNEDLKNSRIDGGGNSQWR